MGYYTMQRYLSSCLFVRDSINQSQAVTGTRDTTLELTSYKELLIAVSGKSN